MAVPIVSLEQRKEWAGRDHADAGESAPRFMRAALRLPLWGKIAGANLVIVFIAGAVLYTQLPEARSQLETTGVIAIVVGLLVNLALVRVALQPLRELEATAGRVWRGELDARVRPRRSRTAT